ncbi:MAG TPA: DMT family transporter [Bacillota bacterium]|nr:DMT family transporter [Bacillota bacterium]
MNFIYYLLSLAAGAVTTLQVGVNGNLRSALSSPVLASLISFTVGAVGLLAVYGISVLSGIQGVPALAALKQTQWWLWTGGLLGAFIVFSTIIIPPKIGYANMFALVIAGQLVLAILFDHFGIFGNQVHSINPYRAAGVVLMIISVYVIQTN